MSLQLFGFAAIMVGTVGAWVAGRHRAGWLIGVAASALWLPPLIEGQQWAALANAGLWSAIGLRNFLVGKR